MSKNFTHLHVHSSFSLLDGYSSPKKLVSRAKELGMTTLAITDHNHLLGIPDFQKACIEADIKPILGYEAYYTEDMSILSLSKDKRDEWAMDRARKFGPDVGFDFDAAYYDLRFPWDKRKKKRCKEKKVSKKDLNELLKDYQYDTTNFHLILLAKNQEGWKNLIKIQSESAEKCVYNGRYHCDLNLLKKYHNGIICTTACIGSYFANKIINGEYEAAKNKIKEFKEVFGDDFYLEIQPLNIPKQHKTNYFLLKFAKELGIKVIATNDIHYAMKDDNVGHNIIVNLGLQRTISDTSESMIYSHDYWLRSYEEMIEYFKLQSDNMFIDSSKYSIDTDISNNYMNYVEEALENTNLIADKIDANIEIGSKVPLFPNVKIPEGYTVDGYLQALCLSALFEYKKEHPEIDINLYFKRLFKELHIIKKKGYSPYFLAVYNYVNYCKREKIPVGPGRGSASGSLCLYMLKITSNIDPIKYDLSFERFLTEDRTSPPDIDLDFSYTRRDKVIRYLQDYYGIEFVASIGNIGVLGVKSGLKDVARYFEIPFKEANEITSKIDGWFDKPDLSFEDIDDLAKSEVEADKKIYSEYLALENKYPEVFKYAREFEGIAKTVGIHASGVLITPMPITDIVPTRTSDGVTITLWSGVQLEDYGLVKFDILALRNLDVIDETLKLINKDYTYYNIYNVLQEDDKDTYKLIQNKATDGLFQLESDLFKHTIGEMLPTCLNDIAALNAICRPGPLSAGLDKQYNDTKNAKIDMTEPLRGTLDMVKDTYGAIIYQEQVMAISVKVCGFNANQSDSIVRRIIGKKKQEQLGMLRRMMIFGKLNQDGPEGWEEDENLPWYDPKRKYGDEISGALANGYTYEEMDKFFKMLLGFASYCFNKSHAMCYGFIGYMTAYLKAHYSLQFMTALLSMQDNQDKINRYIGVARDLGITVKAPDINKSSDVFSISGDSIYYGLNTIKSVGAAAIPNILENQPYNSFGDFYDRTNHTCVKKNVIANLILAGCFDDFESNRYKLIKDFVDIKNIKDEEDSLYILSKENFTKDKCIEHEKELLGTSITYVPFWETVPTDTSIELNCTIQSVSEKTDKNGRLMGFIDIVSEGTTLRALIFSSKYKTLRGVIDLSNTKQKFLFRGKKSDKTTLIVDDVERVA